MILDRNAEEMDLDAFQTIVMPDSAVIRRYKAGILR